MIGETSEMVGEFTEAGEVIGETREVVGDFAEAGRVIGETKEVTEILPRPVKWSENSAEAVGVVGEIGEVVGGLAGDLTTGRSPEGETKEVFLRRTHVRALGTREPNPGKE